MDLVIKGFLERNLPDFVDSFVVSITGETEDKYSIYTDNGKVIVYASNYICAFNGIYTYLKKYCNVQLSWCGNKKINIKELTMFDGKLEKHIEQKFRVYMNYCTLDYSMCWWDFDRWEKEIDFMAMNGINMPLGVVGCEAVWYETLRSFGFTEKEALNSVSGPAFWAWQMMTNIEGYLPPSNKKYIYERLELGQKIMSRYLEFGMQPIQQGFSGHVPVLLKEKFPKAKILMQRGWCNYPETAQLDPLDPLFFEFGTRYLETMDKLFGNHHYIACDPFHEGTPPKRWKHYLKAVGKAINRLYESFDKDSVWVMQAWSMRKHIVKAVPKNRLLILDLNSEKTPVNKLMWGYPVVLGMLHDFGGKNAMQGQLKRHSKNIYRILKDKGANAVGTGLFMEGIDQNPVVYDLQFELLTASEKIDLSDWLDDYIKRRYGKYNKAIREAWNILLETCYRDDGYREEEVGSMIASRPKLKPTTTSTWSSPDLFYDAKKFEKAVSLFLSVSEEFKESDGYQFDACDLVRQTLSNRFCVRHGDFKKAFEMKNADEARKIADEQLEILLNEDKLLSHRGEMCLSRWICDSHDLASDEDEKRYFDMNARTQITLWGDVNGDPSLLRDYSWREWSGLIKEYYYVRWSMFYDEALRCLKTGDKLMSDEFDKKLYEFELSWGKTYSEYDRDVDSDVLPDALEFAEKYNII